MMVRETYRVIVRLANGHWMTHNHVIALTCVNALILSTKGRPIIYKEFEWVSYTVE